MHRHQIGVDQTMQNGRVRRFGNKHDSVGIACKFRRDGSNKIAWRHWRLSQQRNDECTGRSCGCADDRRDPQRIRFAGGCNDDYCACPLERYVTGNELPVVGQNPVRCCDLLECDAVIDAESVVEAGGQSAPNFSYTNNMDRRMTVPVVD